MFKNLKLRAIKTVFLALIPFLLHLKFTLAGGAPGLSWPPLSSVFPDIPHLAATLLVWYELLVRFVPSAANNSIVSALGTLLNMLVPNTAITDSGALGTHVTQDVVYPSPVAGGTGSAV